MNTKRNKINPVDTAVFTKFIDDYKSERRKLDVKLYMKMNDFLLKNRKDIVNGDVKRLLEDDIGEAFFGMVPDDVVYDILNMVEKV